MNTLKYGSETPDVWGSTNLVCNYSKVDILNTCLSTTDYNQYFRFLGYFKIKSKKIYLNMYICSCLCSKDE